MVVPRPPLPRGQQCLQELSAGSCYTRPHSFPVGPKRKRRLVRVVSAPGIVIKGTLGVPDRQGQPPRPGGSVGTILTEHAQPSWSRGQIGLVARLVRQVYPKVYLAKIASVRLNALSTASAGVIPFLMTSEWHWPQSCSALTWPMAGLKPLNNGRVGLS